VPRIPVRIQHTHRALNQVLRQTDPGLHFIVIEDGVFDDAMEHYLDGFFKSVGGEFYRKANLASTIGPVDPEILEMVRDQRFDENYQGMQLKLSQFDAGDGEMRMGYSSDGSPVPEANPSYNQINRIICMANDILRSKSSFFGFLYDGARFDEPMSERFDLLFSRLYSRILEDDNSVFFFYNDDTDSTFSKRFLRRSMRYDRIARIVDEGAVPLTSYRKCFELMKIKAKRILESPTPVVFFLGAGTSEGSGMPLGEEVLEHALREMFNDQYSNRETAKEDFLRLIGNPPGMTKDMVTSEQVISYMSKEEPNFPLLKTVSYLTKRNQDATQTADQRKLVNFCMKKHDAILVTTNFDTKLEESDEIIPIFRTQEFDDISGLDRAGLLEYFSAKGKIGLIKLHGSLEEPITLRIRMEDVQTLSSPKMAVLEHIFNPALQEDKGKGLGPVPAFFVGYGFHDPDLLPLIRSLDSDSVQMIIVSPDPNLRMLELVEPHGEAGGGHQLISIDFESLIEAFTSD